MYILTKELVLCAHTIHWMKYFFCISHLFGIYPRKLVKYIFHYLIRVTLPIVWVNNHKKTIFWTAALGSTQLLVKLYNT